MNELSRAIWSDTISARDLVYVVFILIIILIALDAVYNAVYKSLASTGNEYVSSVITASYTKMRNTLITTFTTILAVLGAGIPSTIFVALEISSRQSKRSLFE